jgi:hypothetical protein
LGILPDDPAGIALVESRVEKEGEEMTQCERILRHLRDYGSITPMEAMEYGCMRLAARIADLLKRRGFNIKTAKGKGENRYGEPTTFAVYYLAV